MNLTTVFSNLYTRTNTNGVSVQDTFPSTTFEVDQNFEGFFENVWEVETSEDTLTPTNISTPGYAFFRNVSTDDFVDIGFASGDYFTRLFPGEFAWLRMYPSVTTLYALADTASVSVQVKIFND